MGGLKGGGDWGGPSVLVKVHRAMDQEYERRLLRQLNHQNLPEAQLAKVNPSSSLLSIFIVTLVVSAYYWLFEMFAA